MCREAIFYAFSIHLNAYAKKGQTLNLLSSGTNIVKAYYRQVVLTIFTPIPIKKGASGVKKRKQASLGTK